MTTTITPTFRLPVTDIVTSVREVQIEANCPRCGADLKKEGAMRHWEYQDQSRDAHLEGDGNSKEDMVDVDDAEDDLPECGSSFISMSWHCQACNFVLASGSEDGTPSATNDGKVEER